MREKRIAARDGGLYGSGVEFFNVLGKAESLFMVGGGDGWDERVPRLFGPSETPRG